MFHYISGTVAELLPNIAVIDCGGIGFQINTSAWSLGQLKPGTQARLYTHVYIRDDVFELYGFATKSEKRCFELLIGVSGVGPKAAVSILSVGAPEDLVLSILSGEERVLTAASGVGKKTAQRVILELKDKLAKETESVSFADVRAAAPAVGGQGRRGDAAAALAVLGYSNAEISAALKQIDTDTLTLEEIIKAALQRMIE
ncbi:MAG: Holliday junction branch migration protein RuvA [Oscillospiraceae bacterium]|nr:Holliday junction branch migration protein RuvA [Oscillospiraceae bacterium]